MHLYGTLGDMQGLFRASLSSQRHRAVCWVEINLYLAVLFTNEAN